ncbi:amino acid permease [Lentisphaerota bacterium WC36G]|nr:amino acid permease [Lentisphaerae bacterium WC36]
MKLFNDKKPAVKFGTFAGVFTPSILTIFGLIMFMRTGEVVGNSGIIMAIVILLIAELITLATGVSISAVSTNTPVKGGGAYFLISRALGPAYGSAIGFLLFVAQTLSVPFYILGFAEAIVTNIKSLQPYFFWINIIPGIVLFIIALISTSWAIKTQFFILGILSLAIIAFITGSFFNGPFSFETFTENLNSVSNYDFFFYFALFFPAVTGILAGVNMSGDLKNPQKAIPKGTILAILVGWIVYGIQILITGGSFARDELINSPYESLVKNAIFGSGIIVFAGVVAATMSSALGSLLGAPRVLQALARDKILGFLTPFKHGSGESDEPKRAMTLTFVVTMIVLIWAGSQGVRTDKTAIDPLNIVAEIVAMFFLYTYAMVNLAAFVESFGKNPSFRPRFKYFHWSISLFGAIACIITTVMINFTISFVAFSCMAVLFFIVRRRSMSNTFGDARRGFVYSRIRDNLLNLAKMPADPKNWRPTICVLSGNPINRKELVDYANLFTSKRGILSIVKVVVDNSDNLRLRRHDEMEAMNEFAKQNKYPFFPEVIVGEDFDTALAIFLQSHSLGPIKPNIIMTGWPSMARRVQPFFKHIKLIKDLNLNSVIVIGGETPSPLATTNISKDILNEIYPEDKPRYIDIWWRGMNNGSLMVILSYLMTLNNNYKDVKIRLLRLSTKEMRSQQIADMEKLVHSARIEAEIKIITSQKSFSEVFRYISKDSELIFMGFGIINEDSYQDFYENMNSLLNNMPTTFLISSNGEANLMA